MTQVVAGDIGGTNARFALVDEEGGKAGTVLHQEVLESKMFPTFGAALDRFLETAREKTGKQRPKFIAASFGIAGPVVDQRVKTTNLPWLIDAKAISEEFSIPRVTLLNDLVALGLGALASPASKVKSLQCGRPRTKGGNIAVIAAGTGLGEATFVWDGTTHVGCASEGGHVDFAPRNAVEVELWKLLQREYGHVSYERIASGSTIHSLYTFFVRDQGVPESKSNAALVVGARDKNPAVVDSGGEREERGGDAGHRALVERLRRRGGQPRAEEPRHVGRLLVRRGVGASREDPRRGIAEPAQEETCARQRTEPVPRGLPRQGAHATDHGEDPDRDLHESLAGLRGAAAHAAAQSAKKR